MYCIIYTHTSTHTSYYRHQHLHQVIYKIRLCTYVTLVNQNIVELDFPARTHQRYLVSRISSPSGFRARAILWFVHGQRVGLDPWICHCGVGHHSCSTKQAYRTHRPYRTRQARPLLGVKRTGSHPAIRTCWQKVPRREHC